MNGSEKKVLVFRSDYLPISETFISDHLRSLTSYQPIVVCEKIIRSSHLIDIKPHELYSSWIGRKFYQLFSSSFEFKRLIKNNKPNIVHAHFLIDAVKILPMMEKIKIPFVVTAHGYDATLNDEALNKSIEGRLFLKVRRRLIKRVDKIVCVSELIKQELIYKGFPERKLEVCHLGIDLNQFSDAKLNRRVSTAIVTVGRLVEKKGTKFLIEAYSKLPKQLRQKHPLHIIGDGPLLAELKLLATNLNCNVVFFGARTRAQVLEHLQNAHLFVLPSIKAENGDSEGMPIAIMEALALGLPVCIFDNQSMATFFKEYEAGLLVQPNNSDDLSKKILNLLNDYSRAKKYSENGIKLAEKHFDLNLNTQLLEKIYDQVQLQFLEQHSLSIG